MCEGQTALNSTETLWKAVVHPDASCFFVQHPLRKHMHRQYKFFWWSRYKQENWTNPQQPPFFPNKQEYTVWNKSFLLWNHRKEGSCSGLDFSLGEGEICGIISGKGEEGCRCCARQSCSPQQSLPTDRFRAATPSEASLRQEKAKLYPRGCRFLSGQERISKNNISEGKGRMPMLRSKVATRSTDFFRAAAPSDASLRQEIDNSSSASFSNFLRPSFWQFRFIPMVYNHVDEDLSGITCEKDSCANGRPQDADVQCYPILMKFHVMLHCNAYMNTKVKIVEGIWIWFRIRNLP